MLVQSLLLQEKKNPRLREARLNGVSNTFSLLLLFNVMNSGEFCIFLSSSSTAICRQRSIWTFSVLKGISDFTDLQSLSLSIFSLYSIDIYLYTCVVGGTPRWPRAGALSHSFGASRLSLTCPQLPTEKKTNKIFSLNIFLFFFFNLRSAYKGSSAYITQCPSYNLV
jgi:hypothetical protein